ncbi:zinc-binding protein A33-like [Hemibagrus wyckioides]|uniref:zinc-binding protein A33-like n=1 Tax=Hemibagrus wyckioides TaxID=337641 RepID=UPI00266B76DF|nr:zinc-binding protein A33-like [Hemibagrus wyckioides]
MASKRSFSEDDFTCPVCCDVFKEPVLLSCGHSACSSCVHRYWETKGCRECPLCRKRSSRNPPVNLALKNLCQTFLKVRCDSEILCDIHGEELKLVCVEDRQLACLVCKYSRKHLQHRVISVDEAAAHLKQRLTRDMNALEFKMKTLEDVQFHCDQNIDHIKQQAEYIKNRINVEIQELVQFLMEEKEDTMSKLDMEVRQKLQTTENRIKNNKQTTRVISSAIGRIKGELKSENIRLVKNRLKNNPTNQDRDSNCNVTSGGTTKATTKPDDPKMVSKDVIDVAKYLGNLQFRLWNKMQTVVKYTPVILDPNTAHSQLVLSPDLTSVRDSDDDHENKDDKPRPPVLDTPERFRSLCVLGSEGFSSGLHCWDVDVGNSTFWMLGVTTESVQRKEPNVFPSGIWGIGYDGQNLSARSPYGVYTPLTLAAKQQVIRIRLDMDSEELWFIDPGSNAVIHMFSHQFTEKVFPFFHSMCSLSPLKILPFQHLVVLRNVFKCS